MLFFIDKRSERIKKKVENQISIVFVSGLCPEPRRIKENEYQFHHCHTGVDKTCA